LKTDEVKKGFSARGLAEAKEKLDFLKLSLEEQTEYDRKMNRRSSFNSVMKTARMEGRFEGEAYGFEIGMLEGGAQGEARGFEKGKLEGEAHGKMEMARKMKSEGISIDIISKVTGLPKNEI
jgi:flagellar biosynthesis/type III secretory pathway protein FliH